MEKSEEHNSFRGFPLKEDQNNFIYPFFAKRKTGSYYSHRGGQESVYSIHEDFNNLASKISKIGNASHPRNEEFVKLCKEIIGFKIGLIPGEGANEDKIGIYVTDSSYVPIESMGEGVVNILGLIVILLTQNNKLFLLEEIENDIHPSALKRLLELIIEKSSNNQFIVSTHSNIVLKYLGSDDKTKIFNILWSPLEETPNETLNISTSVIKEIENLPSEKLKLLESLGYDFFDFDLYKSYLIFEESSAEQVVKEFIIPYMVPELKDSIRTIAAQGADDLYPKFNDLNRLFLYVHTAPIYKERAWVIADGDKTGIENITYLKDKFKTWPEKHFINFKEPNFEKYYPPEFGKKIEDLFKIEDKRKLHFAKGKLAKEVVDWCKANEELAKKSFNHSAKEVIEILKEISKSIN